MALARSPDNSSKVIGRNLEYGETDTTVLIDVVIEVCRY